MKTKIINMFILLTLYAWINANCQDVIQMSDDFENGLNQWEFFEKTTMESLPDEAILVNFKND